MKLSKQKEIKLQKLSKEFERESKNLVLFCEKHGFDVYDIEFLTENTIQIADYYVSPQEVNFDIETNQPEENFFDIWYDLIIEEKIKIDYKDFCSKIKNYDNYLKKFVFTGERF